MKLSLVLMVLLLLVPPGESVAARADSGRPSNGYRSYKGAKAIDGDTFRYRGQRYRLRDYNAPERGQKGAASATRNLQRKLDAGYQYKMVGKDVYSRRLVEEKSPR